MTQDEIDLVYSLTITIFQDKWFREKERTRDEVQDWVREKLASFEIYTMPCGMSWGSLCSKELYDEFGK
ncbi:hypothetical protein M0Q97_05795 [Candidatus Dojkabacteria bacterium]|nr:hypothetical protein [Candidatus Dojkabacteria bacterium]